MVICQCKQNHLSPSSDQHILLCRCLINLVHLMTCHADTRTIGQYMGMEHRRSKYAREKGTEQSHPQMIQIAYIIQLLCGLIAESKQKGKSGLRQGMGIHEATRARIYDVTRPSLIGLYRLSPPYSMRTQSLRISYKLCI